MLPVIGLIGAFYVLTRYVSFLTRTGAAEEPKVVQLLSIVGILLTCVLSIVLIVIGGGVGPGNGFPFPNTTPGPLAP